MKTATSTTPDLHTLLDTQIKFFLFGNEIRLDESLKLHKDLDIAIEHSVILEALKGEERQAYMNSDTERLMGVIPFMICIPKKKAGMRKILNLIDLGGGKEKGTLFLKEENIVDSYNQTEEEPYLLFNIRTILPSPFVLRELDLPREKESLSTTLLTFQETLCLLVQFPHLLTGDKCGVHVGTSQYVEGDSKFPLHIYRFGSNEYAFPKVAREHQFVFDLRWFFPTAEKYSLE